MTPCAVSVSVERGLAYWPAKRPMRVTRFLPPCTSTRLICSRIFSLLAIADDSQSSKLSEQSPPCSRNRSPRVASASWCLRFSISQLVTSGGSRASCSSVRWSASGFGYTGCWAAGLACHEVGDQLPRAAFVSAAVCIFRLESKVGYSAPKVKVCSPAGRLESRPRPQGPFKFGMKLQQDLAGADSAYARQARPARLREIDVTV